MVMPSGEWGAQIPVKQTRHGGNYVRREMSEKHGLTGAVSIRIAVAGRHSTGQGINGLPQRILRDNALKEFFFYAGELSQNFRDPREPRDSIKAINFKLSTAYPQSFPQLLRLIKDWGMVKWDRGWR